MQAALNSAQSESLTWRVGRRRTAARSPAHIVHVIHQLAIGGLENGLVNLINRMPHDRFRHTIVCMTDYSDFSQRLQRFDVDIFAMHKKLGQDYSVYGRLFRLFKRVKPDLVHTRNLTALDSLLPAMLAGVRHRIHGEHGWDMSDLDGTSAKHRWLRKLHSPMVGHYVALSKDLGRYLHDRVGIAERCITQIYNGVDTDRFHPPVDERERLPWSADSGEDMFVVGTVGRMQPVKDQLTLARAFVMLMRDAPRARERVRLAMIGDGPLLEPARAILNEGGVAEYAWLPGARDDVPQMMRAMSVFALPSLAEGISNTILEAMASGLPAVATAVGGNPELVQAGETGVLVPSADPRAIADTLLHYYVDEDDRRRHARNARRQAERNFSMAAMVDGYVSLYERMLAGEMRCAG